MTGPFCDVQRIVLSGGAWQVSQQLLIGSNERSTLPRFLNCLLDKLPPSAAGQDKPALQVSLGFSRRGLESARVPRHVLASFAAKAPAFAAGAAPRAASHVGSCGRNAPAHWDPAFAFTDLDAVLSLHAARHGDLDTAVAQIRAMARAVDLPIAAVPRAEWLLSSDGHPTVHFGYRESLSHVGIEGWTPQRCLDRLKPVSRHKAGEFVLGHPQNSHANPWLSSGGQQVWPDELRAFFHNGSFGVLQQIQQYVSTFEAYLVHAARAASDAGIAGLGTEEIRAKLCGRTREGRPVGRPGAEPEADFDYEADTAGVLCPFGAHVRRMNPRGDAQAHTRARPLLRRGMPYGPTPPTPDGNDSRGLMGLFFCASIEDQVEHLLGQWGERVPLGSADRGGARDPLIGGHEPGDGGFEIPLPGGKRFVLPAMPAFTRTRGTAYLFYPSVTVLQRIARNEVFADLSEPAD